MTRILTILAALVLLPTLALAESVKESDLVKRDGIVYKKFTDVPFTGEVTGLVRGNFVDGRAEEPWEIYDDEGLLWQRRSHKNGEWHGPYASYHENGQLEEKTNYKNGRKDGPSAIYYENGRLWFEGSYKNEHLDSPHTLPITKMA